MIDIEEDSLTGRFKKRDRGCIDLAVIRYPRVSNFTDFNVGEKIKGHEFHYFDSTDNGDCVLARKPVTGRAYSCIIEGENFWAGFPHLYYPSNPEFARAFVEKAGR